MTKEKILYTPLRGIGDIVHSLPLLHSIKRWSPESHVIIPLVDKDQQKIPKSFGCLLDNLINFSYYEINQELENERLSLYRNPTAKPELYKIDSQRRKEFEKRLYDFYLNGEKYDIAIVPRNFKIDTIESYSQVTLNDIDKNTYSHMVDRSLKFAKLLGIPPQIDFSLNIPDGIPRNYLGEKIDLPSDYVIMLISSGRNNKNWNFKSLKQTIKHLNKNHISSVIVGSPGEYEISKELQEISSINLTHPSSWFIDTENFANLSRNSSCVIGPDTGLIHIADAAGAKVIGLYGPTRPEKFGPYNNINNTISTNNTTKKMEDISSREVINRLEKIILKN